MNHIYRSIWNAAGTIVAVPEHANEIAVTLRGPNLSAKREDTRTPTTAPMIMKGPKAKDPRPCRLRVASMSMAMLPTPPVAP